ncbi:hypothetical protein HK405_009876, partial [Cladochytrium tenue]
MSVSIATVAAVAVVVVVAVSAIDARARAYARRHALNFLPPPTAQLALRADRLRAQQTAAATTTTSSGTTPDAPRYLVVGGSGGLGREVVAVLLRRDPAPRVVVFDMVDLWTEKDSRVATVVGDIRDPDAVARAMAGCTHVINVAGLIPIDLYIHKQIYDVNVVGGRNVLEAALKTLSVKSFVYTSSISAEVGWNRLSTLDPPMPLSKIDHYFPYARSKNSTTVVIFRAAANLLWLMGKPMDWIGAADLARAHVLLSDALADPARTANCAGKTFRLG